jgi:hypothetical protein
MDYCVAGLTDDDFNKMTPAQRIAAGICQGVDWREGWMDNDGHESNPGFPTVTIGLHKHVPTRGEYRTQIFISSLHLR